MTTGSFVKKLAEDNQKEVDMARAASSRAKSAEVKNYAQQSPRWGLRFCCANLGVGSEHEYCPSSGPIVSHLADKFCM